MTASRERVGHPTQFHGVPLEERAFDSQGKRLPWALEWADDHPNARHQKRQAEEKGSFGKSTRRQGSSRATRTQTPAKRENTALDGFDAALKFDAQQEPERQSSSSSKGPSDGSASHQPALSLAKEPSQAILYGFAPDTQWAAISFYEGVSGGIICEDYDRDPPVERKRYQNSFENASCVHARPLTKAEKALAFQYRGGQCWIKVTFDSIEAAERAIYYSPHLISGHWVCAEAYRGHGPAVDEPILMIEDDRGQGVLGAPKHISKQSRTLGASFSMPSLGGIDGPTRGNATLPRSFVTVTGAETNRRNLTKDPSISSSTASSATAIEPEYPSLRLRNTPQAGDLSNNNIAVSVRSETFSHFPNTPRTVIRPASEAFLPQKSWTESILKRLTWISPDFIGNSVPRLENGDFDWPSASLYWKFFYWIDTFLGTDWCGIKEN